MYSQPLLVKLQKSTYKQYKGYWKRMLAFVCRTSTADAKSRLRHRLTSRQTALLDNLLTVGAQHTGPGCETTLSEHSMNHLDDLCLDFCIALLDHDLKDDLYESAALGFLAVIGIDKRNSRFYKAQNYTPILSGIIKIGQMLVLQKAVRDVEKGLADDPLDILDEMRRKFMTVECRRPISWAIQLRSYGKKIRDCTTSLGYIQWSDDGNTVYYKNLELQITSISTFVKAQVRLAQDEFEKLLLLHPEETRSEITPQLQLHRIRDNPTIVSEGWNFLQDDRNADVTPDRSLWLLKRVLDNDWLRDEFVSVDFHKKIVWKTKAICEYLRNVDRFLERLLLLVHIISGQPARGTEIISLRHTNTIFHRNVFIEDGLVALVTSYHKGYTCTGSTKVIHRYLPKEVGELLIYYLWLILPFVNHRNLLAPTTRKFSNAFLWSQPAGCWTSQRLTDVLKRETLLHLNAPLNISIYRHLAIAISRCHLQGRGFKRDYDVTEKASDQQTTHNSWTAGRLYARGLEEAQGHVEARRSEFRAVSREWHNFLGFVSFLGARKRQLGENVNLANVKRTKREAEIEYLE